VKINHEFTKTVLYTVFFYASSFGLLSCKSVENTSYNNKNITLKSKYEVRYKVDTKSSTNEYYRGANAVFFPLLELKQDGTLENNYLQKTAVNEDFWLIYTLENLPINMGSVAENFCKHLNFTKEPFLHKVPSDISTRSSYFIKFYYYNNNLEMNMNFLYLKMIIEWFDLKGKNEAAQLVWIGEGNFAYDKKISLETLLTTGMNTLIKYSFINANENGSVYLLNN